MLTMESILAYLGILHFAASIWAGVIGDTRTCGFISGFFSWLINPLLGMAVLLTAKDKRG